MGGGESDRLGAGVCAPRPPQKNQKGNENKIKITPEKKAIKKEKKMIMDITPDGCRRGALIWGNMPLPAGVVLLGVIRLNEKGGEEALLLMNTGSTIVGIAGVLRLLPPIKPTCLRCGHTWFLRGCRYPHSCPSCHSPYWASPKKNGGGKIN